MLPALLVALQFAALALLLLLPPWPALTPLVLLTGALGAALGSWTLLFNRLGNFNIRPQPKAGGKLITGGPYRYIRHPMYSALLLMFAGVAHGNEPGYKLGIWVLLAVVLVLKARLEEQGLLRIFPGYAQYRRTSKRFIPFIW